MYFYLKVANMYPLSVSFAKHQHALHFKDIVVDEKQVAIPITKLYTEPPSKLESWVYGRKNVLLSVYNKNTYYIRVNSACLAKSVNIAVEKLFEEMATKGYVNDIVRESIDRINRQAIVDAIEKKQGARAYFMAEAALKMGDGEAGYLIAKACEKGQIGSKGQTIKWLKKAAREIHSEASFELGMFYRQRNEHGDLKKSLEYLSEAEELGSEAAKKFLEQLNRY